MPRIYVMPENARSSLGGNAQSLRPTRPEHQQRQRQDQQFEGGENFDYYVDRKLDGGTTEGYGETAGSVFIFNFAVATMANELELMAVQII